MENANSQDRLLDNRLRSALAAMLTNLASPPGILEYVASTTARSARLYQIVDGTPPKWLGRTTSRNAASSTARSIR